MVVFAPAAKMNAVAIDDTPQTIFAAGITRVISHNFSFSPRVYYIHTILQVMLWNQLLIRGVSNCSGIFYPRDYLMLYINELQYHITQ